MPDPSVIDPQAIENLRALNPDDNDEFLREIVNIYLEDTPLRIKELEDSLTAKDAGKFTRAAHSIKGSSSNLGATVVRAVAEKIEHDSRSQGVEGGERLIVELKQEYARAEAELKKLIGSK